MLISEREAADHLGRFAALTRTPARLLLKTGVAGTPLGRPDGSLGYDVDAVDALTLRSFVTENELAGLFPTGLVVARLAPTRAWDVRARVDEHLVALAGPWRMSFLVHGGLTAFIRRDGPFPLVATMSGFILAGAEITRLRWHDQEALLELRPPGDWFTGVEARRWLPGRGGRPLHLWMPPHHVVSRTAALRR